jgi:hypothetical protein
MDIQSLFQEEIKGNKCTANGTWYAVKILEMVFLNPWSVQSCPRSS